jgi:hypothetical protein
MFNNRLTGRPAGSGRAIGIDVRRAALADQTFLPALDIQYGAIAVDEQRLVHPGDALHEAGHIALGDPASRSAPTRAPTEGEAIARLACSYTELRHLDLDPDIVIHPDDRKGGSQSQIDNFTSDHYLGVPLLDYFRMAAALGVDLYPQLAARVKI